LEKKYIRSKPARIIENAYLKTLPHKTTPRQQTLPNYLEFGRFGLVVGKIGPNFGGFLRARFFDRA
jgi:hypothetical protein